MSESVLSGVAEYFANGLNLGVHQKEADQKNQLQSARFNAVKPSQPLRSRTAGNQSPQQAGLQAAVKMVANRVEVHRRKALAAESEWNSTVSHVEETAEKHKAMDANALIKEKPFLGPLPSQKQIEVLSRLRQIDQHVSQTSAIAKPYTNISEDQLQHRLSYPKSKIAVLRDMEGIGNHISSLRDELKSNELTKEETLNQVNSQSFEAAKQHNEELFNQFKKAHDGEEPYNTSLLNEAAQVIQKHDEHAVKLKLNTQRLITLQAVNLAIRKGIAQLQPQHDMLFNAVNRKHLGKVRVGGRPS